ncbi:MAG TPA: class I SAM-dependent methyltransferase [Steroidobacteraceae bacterium]|jgi:SAM-dependent methyltransferase|nr:class I SAM-dependent methyltransferase [Steroidobacteraceae bacterium]
MSRQRDVFMSAEGDAWFSRNETALAARDWSRDPICRRLEALPRTNEPSRTLEIGCSDGSRLQYLAGRGRFKVFGIEPSGKAVAKARERGIEAIRTTADNLPFADASMDIVIFGFCLYLCDDRDLFRIAHEADRVLASPGWLLILDFEARAPTYRSYSHQEGIRSRKMNYASMFAWHPAYTLASYEKFYHGSELWTDDPDEWVSLACLRKYGPTQ